MAAGFDAARGEVIVTLDGDWMLEVAGWHRELGDLEAARELCTWVLEEIPDNAAAAKCLDELAD